MSSDDMISIIKIGNKFFGYRIMLSLAPPQGFTMENIIENGSFKFEASSVEEAILEAQSIDTEYGYGFYNLRILEDKMKELSTDSIFYDPSDFICPKCQKNTGMWLHDKTGNGIAIRCRNCGNRVDAYRSWLTELRSRHSKPKVKENG